MSTWNFVMPFAAPQVLGLADEDQQVLNELVAQWAAKRARNHERLVYLDLRTLLKDLGAALPPELVSQLEVVVGWPQKAVDELASRIVLDGFAGTDQNPLGLGDLLADNQFAIEFPQAVTSSLSQSLAFVTTTPDPDVEVLLQFHSALWATGLWSRRRRALTAGLIFLEADKLQRPTRLLLLVPGEVVECAAGANGWYIEAVTPTGLGERIPMEPLPYRPSLERPFGRSRIDRGVMSITDRAMRGAARLEIHAELFSALKLILLGVGEDAFEKSRWSWFLDRINTLTKDEDGDLPKLEKVTAESPEPHIAVMRQLAAEFSGHTGVPLGSLGIATDNPESQGAKQEARQDTIGHAEGQHQVYGAALKRAFGTALMIRDRLTEPPPGLRDVQLVWRPPNRPTLAAVADAGAKQVAAVPGLAETTVGMELLGLTPQQIERFQRERAEMGPVGIDRLADVIGRQTGDGGGRS